MIDRVPAMVPASEVVRELPMSPIAYGLVAFGLFLLALAVLYSFRNTAKKIGSSGNQAVMPDQQHGAVGHGSTAGSIEGGSGSHGVTH